MSKLIECSICKKCQDMLKELMVALFEVKNIERIAVEVSGCPMCEQEIKGKC